MCPSQGCCFPGQVQHPAFPYLLSLILDLGFKIQPGCVVSDCTPPHL